METTIKTQGYKIEVNHDPYFPHGRNSRDTIINSIVIIMPGINENGESVDIRLDLTHQQDLAFESWYDKGGSTLVGDILDQVEDEAEENATEQKQINREG